jgi:glycosyltransferase involved in cell wall biosynthesis
LPSEEIKKYFRIDLLRGKCIVVPNYPSFAFYKKIKKAEYNGGPINLIYQGRISEDHFLEETIVCLKQNIHGRNLKLHLIGQWAPDYQNKLLAIADREGVRERLEFHAGMPYQELPNFTRANQVGLAIHKPTRIIYLTGGTASNKIYEYAALGLPVLLYDNEHYKAHLSNYNWSFFTSGLKESIVAQLEKIMSEFETASLSARKDFEERLHFEKVFEPVRNFLRQSIN